MTRSSCSMDTQLFDLL